MVDGMILWDAAPEVLGRHLSFGVAGSGLGIGIGGFLFAGYKSGVWDARDWVRRY